MNPATLPGGRVVNQTFHVVGVFFPGVGVVAAPWPAIRVGRDGVMHAETVRHVEFPGAVRGQPHRRHVAAVIAIAQRDDIEIAGVSARHEQRQVVRLRAGIDKVAHLQIARHFGRELFGVFGDVRVQINRGGMLQRFVLPARRLDDVRMAMADADGHNAAQAVEIAASLFVKDILPRAFHQHDRLFVIEEDAGIEELAAQLQHFIGGRAGVGLWVDDRREAGPDVFIVCNSNSC